MAKYKVTFKPAGMEVQVDPDLYPYGKHGQPGSLLDIALGGGVQMEHACGGVGVCGSCHVVVEDGAENLSPPSDEELDRVDAVAGSGLDSRLACQAVVRGDVTVSIRTGQ